MFVCIEHYLRRHLLCHNAANFLRWGQTKLIRAELENAAEDGRTQRAGVGMVRIFTLIFFVSLVPVGR